MTDGWQKFDRAAEIWVCSSLLLGGQRTVFARCDFAADSQESVNFDPFWLFRVFSSRQIDTHRTLI
jgi:hypothetical protein